MSNEFFDSAINAIRTYVDQEHKGVVSHAKAALGMTSDTLDKWLRGERKPSLSKLAPILEQLKARIVLPADEDAEAARDICFVSARLVPAGEGQTPPQVEDYLAVPLVEEVGAGPGLIPQGELLSWFLVWRHQKSVAHKRDLIAVKIGKHSTSMEPTLRPEDIVLVDRQDKDAQNFTGRIMLVMDPEGAGKIKRVAVDKRTAQRDWRITFYSDNAAENPPEVWSLREDFDNDWNRAIVGRVIWAWSDVSTK